MRISPKIKPVKKDFYLNPIAQLFLKAIQLVKVLIAGRGFGKSFINGISILMKVALLPRSRGLFISATYTQILTNTLIPMKFAWEWFGYKENVDYVVGRRPPKWFEKPYQKPERYENVITFWNGTTIILGSFDRPQLLRGGNNDWFIVDETLLINKDQLDQIVIPSIRGSHPIFKDKTGHLSQQYTSSMPYGNLGAWLLEKELESKNPDNDTFFIKGTSWHNRVILTDKVLNNWKRQLPTIIYLIEVMNFRIQNLGNLFYPSLKDKHWYQDSYDYDFIDGLTQDRKELKRDSRWDKDCDPDVLINISHDWGAFNSITIDQYKRNDNTIRFINCMYVSHPEIHIDLAKKFCEYYKHHKYKVVHQWGDKSGNKKEANSKLTYFEEFAQVLKKNGWSVSRKKIGDIEHLERHRFISKMHNEDEARLPKVRHNLNNCKDLKIALESAPMKGSKKDKKSENNPAVKQQHATHLTDAYDYRLYHGFKYIEKGEGPVIPMGFVG